MAPLPAMAASSYMAVVGGDAGGAFGAGAGAGVAGASGCAVPLSSTKPG